ncbi:RND transporter [Sulfurifustis variabilis]|uniref:RND transporter n=1 Tax=Sulfurifustis variabilis TaxID=1675686 RepID=A0A1B4VB31_9GAMM|nr:efflux RND transporter periplasmic adaptor subunit [Sulfurifustis variabilis]BAU49194.1 RND transporter [Sulfurifustis variabilis]
MNELNVNGEVAQQLGVDAGSERARRRRRWLGWGALAAVLATAAIAWTLIGDGTEVQYRTQPVQRGDLTVTVTATGTLEPTNQVDVGSELSGIVKTVDVDYNERVKAGQVLARLDTTKLEAQVRQSEAALASAEAKVRQAQATAKEAKATLARLAQVRDISGGKVPSPSDFDAAEAALERAQADEIAARAAVAQAQATLRANRTDLAKAVIRSPINGIVLARSVEPGQTVAAAFQAPVLFTIAEDLAQMELQVDVDEADVGRVQEAQEAAFTVDAYPDRRFPARITRVHFGSQTVEGVVTYETVLAVDNSALALRPGMTATAVITVEKIDDALLVPNAALRFTPPAAGAPDAADDRSIIQRLLPRPPRTPSRLPAAEVKGRTQRVWVLREGAPEPVEIAIGSTDGVMTVVTGGPLEAGTAVVTDAVSAK